MKRATWIKLRRGCATWECSRWRGRVDHSLLRPFVEDFKRIRPNSNHENEVIAKLQLLHVSDLVQRYYGTVCDRFGCRCRVLAYSLLSHTSRQTSSPSSNSTATSQSLRAVARTS
jgi:hypothetical protein